MWILNIYKDLNLQLREMQDICTLACEKFAAGDKVSLTILLGQKCIILIIPYVFNILFSSAGYNVSCQFFWDKASHKAVNIALPEKGLVVAILGKLWATSCNFTALLVNFDFFPFYYDCLSNTCYMMMEGTLGKWGKGKALKELALKARQIKISAMHKKNFFYQHLSQYKSLSMSLCQKAFINLGW